MSHKTYIAAEAEFLSSMSRSDDIQQQIQADLDRIMNDIIEYSEKYKDRLLFTHVKTLLESYALALAMAKRLPDLERQNRIVSTMLDVIKHFLKNTLNVQNSAGLQNFGKNFSNFQNRLISIREQGRQDIALLKAETLSVQAYSEKYSNALRDLFENIVQYVKGLLLDITPNGCQLNIVLLGSLATKQATLYSDVEYIILMNHYNSEYKQYAEHLANVLGIILNSLR